MTSILLCSPAGVAFTGRSPSTRCQVYVAFNGTTEGTWQVNVTLSNDGTVSSAGVTKAPVCNQISNTLTLVLMGNLLKSILVVMHALITLIHPKKQIKQNKYQFFIVNLHTYIYSYFNS